MKVLAIRMKNLASLEGITTIDFTQPPLSTAGIFAITGSTGAGKSTILDALCLALYGKTPRYLQAKEQGIEVRDGKTGFINQGDHRGILRDGTGEGYAEVDFVGVDGNSYTAAWRVRRARDKADGSMQADTIELKNLHSGIVFPGKKKEVADEIERLIGLNFEQFTRSVLLAQGDFATFLKANKDEKSSLLEKLTGTHIYSEISKKIFENHKMQDSILQELNIKREGILTFTPEELISLDEKIKSAKELIERKQIEITAFDKEIAWHQQWKILGVNVETAAKLVTEANENKNNATGRIALLKQVESIQPARKLIDQQNNIANQLDKRNENIVTVDHTILELNRQQQTANVLLETATKAYTEYTEKYDQAKPFLTEARKLDVTLNEKQEQLKDAESALKIAAANFLQNQKIVESNKKKSEELLASIGELEKWKNENVVRQPIAEQESLILSKLGDAGKMLSQSKEYVLQLYSLKKDIEDEGTKIAELNGVAFPLKSKLKAAQDSVGELTSKLSEVNITQLEIDKASADKTFTSLSAAQSHWEKLFDKITEFNGLTQKLTNAKSEHEKKAPQLAHANEELNTLKTKKETSLELLDKARLALTENVEHLRGQLSEGTPCPVCGSEEHPYSMHNPRLDAVMQQLQAEHSKNEKAYEEMLSFCSSLRENISQLIKDIDTDILAIAEKENLLQELKNKWESLPVFETIKDIPDEKRTEWLTTQLNQTISIQETKHRKLTSYNILKKEEEDLLKKIRTLEQQINENTLDVTKREQHKLLLQQQQRNIETENEKLISSLQLTKISLNTFFANEEWFQNWQIDPVAFQQQITSFTIQWKTQTKMLFDDTGELHALQATLKEQEIRLQHLSDEQQSKQALFTGLQQQHDRLTQQRQLIFGGEEANAVEDSLKDALAKALEKLELQKDALQNLQTSIAKATAKKEQLQKDISELRTQEDEARQVTEQWLTTFNQKHSLDFKTDELLVLLQHTLEWIEQEQVALRAMDDAITQAESVLRERTSQLQQHEQQRQSEREFEELKELKEQSTILFQQATQEKTENELLLQQDENNKKRIGDLIGKINEQAEVVNDWAKLNDVIGSSDGKKFRQVAQEYTLDILLGYANMHLQILSPRYLLQRITNTLGLQVLDQDMGDEVRTVFSLSGGESFLVSLALALGLASLSSSRMQVESLFIDEGFGSLDPTTLNIAMDALERLHNQGRKVGVISHVQEMTERIPVQIKVSKQNSGRSKVEIL
jgi:exonuclease SbcC